MADVYNEDIEDDNSDYVEEGEGEEDDSDLGEEEEDEAGTEPSAQQPAEGEFLYDFSYNCLVTLTTTVSPQILILPISLLLKIASPARGTKRKHEDDNDG